MMNKDLQVAIDMAKAELQKATRAYIRSAIPVIRAMSKRVKALADDLDSRRTSAVTTDDLGALVLSGEVPFTSDVPPYFCFKCRSRHSIAMQKCCLYEAHDFNSYGICDCGARNAHADQPEPEPDDENDLAATMVRMASALRQFENEVLPGVGPAEWVWWDQAGKPALRAYEDFLLVD